MPYETSLVAFVRWVSQRFPYFPEYAKIVTPTIIFVFSVATVFFGILPPPGYSYPVPSTEDIRRELKSKSIVIYKLVVFSKWLTIKINTVTKTRFYKFMYVCSGFIANFVSKFRGDKEVPSEVKITKPKIFYVDLTDTTISNDNDNKT